MPFVKTKRGGNSGTLKGEEFLVIAPIVANGDTGKRLPANCLIKYMIIKSTVDTPSFRMGTVANGDDLAYETALTAFKRHGFGGMVGISEIAQPIFISGYVGGIMSVIIIYQKFNL
ncbi:MAG: hypothetical protein H7320_13145 [Ferruginibacter sp.]|nr:hypothetical protein [Ferruginibacter sp.]